MFDLSLYSVVLLVHIASGIFLVGSAVFAPVIFRKVLSAPTLERMRDWLEFLERSIRANPAVAIVLLASGLYLGSAGWWSQPWFYVALASWVANTVLGARIVHPGLAALGHAAAAGGDGPVSDAVDRLRRSRRLEVAVAVMRGSDFAVLYMMYVKPGAVESLAAIALVIIGCLAFERALTKRASRTQLPVPSAATTAAS